VSEVSFNLYRASGLHNLLVSRGMGQADVGRHLVVSGINRRQGRLDIAWGVDGGDQRLSGNFFALLQRDQAASLR